MHSSSDNNLQDFTSGSIPLKLVRFMIPILGALILQAMYGAVDLLIVGRFGTTAGIAAVSTGSNIVNLVVFVLSGLTMGVTVSISRYIGEKREERIKEVIGGVICFFTLTAIMITVFMLLFARQAAIIMKTPSEALDLTTLYIRICGGGILFVISYNVISSIFRGMGNSKLPLIFVAIACIANIFGDLLLVAVFKMNVAGAALATIFAQAMSVLMSLGIIKKQNISYLHITRSDISLNKEVRRFLKVGTPIAFQELLTNITFLALCAFINHLGLEEASGYGVANKLISFVLLIPSSLMQSMSSFVAQNVGAGKEKRATQAMLCGMAIGGGIGIFVGIFIFFKGDLLTSLFTNDAAVIQCAFDYLKGFAPEAVVTCILFSFMGYFNGHSLTLFVMLQGLAQSFLVRLPFSYYMSIQPDANLMRIGWAAPLATCFGIVINLAYFTYFKKKKQKRVYV